MKIIKRFFLLVLLVLAGCGEAEQEMAESAPPVNENEPAGQQAETEPEPSEFLAGPLHDIEIPQQGYFRLEVAGEVFEEAFEDGDGYCGWSMKTTDGQNQDRFGAGSDWTTEDGRQFRLEMRRFVMMDDFFWNLNHGHEADQVTLQVRNSGAPGSIQNLQETAWSRMHILLAQPGNTPVLRLGEGELPSIRVADDGLRATAAGVLQASTMDDTSQFGTALTGPFTLAMHCKE